MAKNRLDWIKLECQDCDEMKLIQAEFGLVGWAIVVKLWQKIGSSEGYYCNWNTDVALLFANENGVGRNVVSEVIEKCFKRDIFSKELFEKYGILTSVERQENFNDIAARRKFSKIQTKYLLLKCAHSTGDTDISSENVDILEENADISSTEEIRREEIRSDERRGDASASPAPSRSPLDQLIYDYGEEAVDKYVKRVKNWYAEKGRNLSDLYGKVRDWLERDNVELIDHSIEKYEFVINKF